MDYIKLLAQIDPEQPLRDAVYYDNCGADELFYDDSASFEEGFTLCLCTEAPPALTWAALDAE